MSEEEETKIKTKRPSKIPDYLAYRRDRARLYYSDPLQRARQNERMKIYREKNRPLIRERNSRRLRLKTIERRLAKFWKKRGLIR